MATKYIFFTGGVVSSVGKGGDGGSSRGVFSKNAGLMLQVQKLDPVHSMSIRAP